MTNTTRRDAQRGSEGTLRRIFGRRRYAFTLMESIVVIAILTIVVGLLLIGLQGARESANRLKCENNLKQVALAVQMYHDYQGSFPSGMRYQGGKDPYLFMTWMTELLPYLEQQSLWDHTLAAYGLSRNPFDDYPHVGMATVMPVFTCPSDGRAAHVQYSDAEQIYVAMSSFLGVEGRDLKSCDGILFVDSRIRISDITDGTSQTLLAGERPPSTDLRFGWWYAGAGQNNNAIATGSADSVLGVEEVNVITGLYPCSTNPSSFGPGQVNNQCDMFHYWSLHPGGANFAFADGSVHFLEYSAAPIMTALASRAGGETIEIP
jgi:prepilin-type processing-associated H-X9-DG protein/prepilin-type N-terminal cleavage/methylation domain-containing protein